jgi:hypothetical protein
MKNNIQTIAIIVLLAGLIYNMFFNERIIVNENIAQLNNKSWQISRAMDSLSDEGGKLYKDLFAKSKTPEEMVDLVGKGVRTDSVFKAKWIKIQTINNRVDSLEKVRFKLLENINSYVDEYSKLHPEENLLLK